MVSLTKEEIEEFKQNAEMRMGVVLQAFVETGTFQAQTTLTAAQVFDQVYTIELSETSYNAVKHHESDKVHFFQGESFQVLETLLPSISQNIFFWLDGHWSGGATAKGTVDCPIIEELDVILRLTPQACLIAIDDVRLFGTYNNEDWVNVTEQSILDKVGSSGRVRAWRYHGDRMLICLGEKV